jgi:hypothetical protein
MSKVSETMSWELEPTPLVAMLPKLIRLLSSWNSIAFNKNFGF